MNAWRDSIESIGLPVLALLGGLAFFGVFVWFGGHDPVEAWSLLFWARSVMRSASRTRCSAPRR